MIGSGRGRAEIGPARPADESGRAQQPASGLGQPGAPAPAASAEGRVLISLASSTK